MRARDLFLALWIPNLFMERVKEDGDWSLFCPNEAPGLSEIYDTPKGKKFTKLYLQYEEEGRARRTVKARELWTEILKAQIETGTPYILYKDSVNNKSNQKNVGTIKSSNLCTEIMEYYDLVVFVMFLQVHQKEIYIDEYLHLKTFQYIESIQLMAFYV